MGAHVSGIHLLLRKVPGEPHCYEVRHHGLDWRLSFKGENNTESRWVAEAYDDSTGDIYEEKAPNLRDLKELVALYRKP